MQLWIIIYSHRHGVDAWPVISKESPDLEKVADDMQGWEPDREEYLEVRGPWTMREGSPLNGIPVSLWLPGEQPRLK